MKKYAHGPDVKFIKAGDGKLPFVVSVTKLMRFIVGDDPAKKAKLENLGLEIATYFENDPVLKDSLKNDPRVKEGRVLRQMDLKGKNGEMIFKSFVMWNTDLGLWHVFLELPHERVWESGDSNV